MPEVCSNCCAKWLSGVGVGYALTKSGKKVCYSCADQQQVSDLLAVDRFNGYVSADWKRWTTWTGGTLGYVTKVGKAHPFSRERFYIRVVDVHGQDWHGVGAEGTYASMRKCRALS